jgi:O-antigen/teichoic acid export membrane protein
MLKSVTPRYRRVLLSGATGVLQRLAQLAASLIILPLVLHRLGETGFGVWGAATSLSWAAGMLDLGLGGALVTLLPAARHRGEDPRDYVTACLLVGVALGLVLLAGGAVVLLAWPRLVPSPPFLVAGLCMAANIPLGLAGSLWFGLQKGHVAGLWDTMQTALMLGFIIAGALAGAGVTVMTLAVFGAGVLANAGSLAHALLTQPELRPKLRPKLAVIGHALRSGALLALISIAGSCAFVFDNVLTLDWLGPQAAAQMTVALKVCITAIGMLMVATQALWPAFVEAVALEDHGWVARTLWRGTLVVAGLACAGSGAIVLAGNQVLALWLRQDLHLPPALFLAMAGWIVALALPRVAGLLLSATTQYRGQFIAQLAATGLALGLKPALAATFGAAGLLGATPLVSLLVLCPAYAWLAWCQVASPRFMKAQPCRS